MTGATGTSPAFLDAALSARALATALDGLGIVSIADPDGRILHVNGAFVRISQRSPEELIGQNHSCLSAGHHGQAIWGEILASLRQHKAWRGHIENSAKDGSSYSVDSTILPLVGLDQKLNGFLSFQREITKSEADIASLQARSALLDTIIQGFPGGLTVFDRDLGIVLMNEKQRELLEYPGDLFRNGLPSLEDLYRFDSERGDTAPEDAEQQIRSRLTSAQNGSAPIFERRRPGGNFIEIRGNPLPTGSFVSAHLNIADRKREPDASGRERLDPLTGLPNRLQLKERIQSALANAKGETALALHCLDVDRFASINDTLGQTLGDTLLVAIADRLKADLRDSDMLIRLGGDEFAILQIAPRSIEEIAALAKRVIAAFSDAFIVGDHTVSIGCTIGIAIGPSDGSDADQLLANADMALYRAKSVGRGTYGFFEHSMHQRLQKRHQIIMGLHAALANSKFELHYQPIVNVKTRRIVGCEALIRWSHPIRGLIPASEFIPIAEECGLIGQISDWVLKRACAEASLWPDDIWVAVNISPAQFHDKDLVEKITSAAKNISLSRLILEVTESLLMKDSEATSATLDQLRKLGIRFSIDDFGTGFSSLSYLQSFPFDKIKIDKSFVSAVANVKRSATLRRSIIQLGYNLGMTSVAEGVETEEQLDRLRAEGCVEAQGFLFSRAVPAAKLRTLFPNPL